MKICCVSNEGCTKCNEPQPDLLTQAQATIERQGRLIGFLKSCLRSGENPTEATIEAILNGESND